MSMLSQAQAWIGRNAADGSHKFIIDIYNDQDKLPRGYKVKYTDFWCATFITVLAIVAKMTDVIPAECSCGKMIEGFKKLGEWVENDAHRPSPGDIIFYDWDDSGKGDNVGYPDHVGIVESVTGNTIIVIEGNMGGNGGRVGRRQIQVNGRYIRGYGVPKRKDNKEPVQAEPTPQPQAQPHGLYRVNVGVFKVHENAMNMLKSLKAKGYDAFIVEINEKYHIQVGAYPSKSSAESLMQKLKADGFDGYITQSNVTAKDYETNFKVKIKCILNVRKGPGINYDIAMVIRDYGIYTIVAQQGSWGKLKSGAGWINISDSYVTKL